MHSGMLNWRLDNLWIRWKKFCQNEEVLSISLLFCMEFYYCQATSNTKSLVILFAEVFASNSLFLSKNYNSAFHCLSSPKFRAFSGTHVPQIYVHMHSMYTNCSSLSSWNPYRCSVTTINFIMFVQIIFGFIAFNKRLIAASAAVASNSTCQAHPFRFLFIGLHRHTHAHTRTQTDGNVYFNFLIIMSVI